MHKPTLSAFVIVTLGALAASCGPSWEEVCADAEAEIETLRPEAAIRLALLDELSVQVEARPTDDYVPFALGDRPAVDVRYLGDPWGGNVGFVSLEHLRTADADLERDPLWLSAFWLERARAFLAGDYHMSLDLDDLEFSFEQLRRPFERLAGLRYLVILRTHELVLPEVAELTSGFFGFPDEGEVGGNGVVDGGTYQAGAFVGEAHVFDLEDHALLGVLPVVTQNSGPLEGTRSPEELAREQLRAYLIESIAEQITDPGG